LQGASHASHPNSSNSLIHSSFDTEMHNTGSGTKSGQQTVGCAARAVLLLATRGTSCQQQML
jgi:hypothetical protein